MPINRGTRVHRILVLSCDTTFFFISFLRLCLPLVGFYTKVTGKKLHTLILTNEMCKSLHEYKNETFQFLHEYKIETCTFLHGKKIYLCHHLLLITILLIQLSFRYHQFDYYGIFFSIIISFITYTHTHIYILLCRNLRMYLFYLLGLV
jgi:hypothetical protein